MEDQKQKLAEKYFKSGVENSKNGQIELAIEDYTQAIKLKPDYAEAYYYRGGSWLRLGEWEKARSDIQNAKKMNLDILVVSDEILQKYERAWKTLGNL